MSGFGLYETLRIFVPGAYAVGAVSLILRLATGHGHLLSQGPFAGVLDGVSGFSYLVAAFAVGFLLYLIDLPNLQRLAKSGDPANGVLLPTAFLERMLKDKGLDASRSFSTYFLLSDAHLPDETHKRVYFFGGIHRIFVDARLISASGFALAAPLSLVVAGAERPSMSDVAALAVTLAAVLIAVFLGESRHRASSVRKRIRVDRKSPEVALADYRRERNEGLVAVAPASAFILILGMLGTFASMQAEYWWRGLGLTLVCLATWLWALIDLGPPDGTTDAPGSVGTQKRMQTRVMRLPPSVDAQYDPVQRGLADSALFVPALFGLAFSAPTLGRTSVELLGWSALALTATVIMVVRKHEIRLIANYRDQVNWLSLNEDHITRVVRDGLGDEWH